MSKILILIVLRKKVAMGISGLWDARQVACILGHSERLATRLLIKRKMSVNHLCINIYIINPQRLINYESEVFKVRIRTRL